MSDSSVSKPTWIAGLIVAVAVVTLIVYGSGKRAKLSIDTPLPNQRVPVTFSSDPSYQYRLETAVDLVAGTWTSATYSVTQTGALTTNLLNGSTNMTTVYAEAPSAPERAEFRIMTVVP